MRPRTTTDFSALLDSNTFQELLRGSRPVTPDIVQRGSTFTIPEGMSYGDAISVLEMLERHRLQESEPTEYTREFPYKLNDGAYATWQELRERFGIVLTGGLMARTQKVQISPTESVEVPWGAFEIPALGNATVSMCGGHSSRELGQIYCLHVHASKQYEDLVQQMFDAIDKRLRTSSIYRGQAIKGCDDPEFINLSGFDPNQVVYSAEVRSMLNASLWSPLKFSDAMRRDGVPLKRAVLLYGPYGTGKTLTGLMTALIAVQNGWTFVSAKPGREYLLDVLRMARLYSPAVVFFEDVDTAA